MFFPRKNKSSNPLIKRYLELREIGRKTHSLMAKEPQIDVSIFVKGSARILGMLKKTVGENVITLEDESDMGVLNDFVYFEYLQDNKSFTELYYELHKAKLSRLEIESFEAKLNYFVSLFEVIDKDSERCEITLRDLLNPEEEDVVIIDFNYSQSVIVGSWMFTRVIPFTDLNMSSGVSFPFYRKNRNKILREHKTNMKKPSGYSEDVRIYKSFYELHKKYGIPIMYKDPEEK